MSPGDAGFEAATGLDRGVQAPGAPLLSVEKLRVRFGNATVVDDVSFTIAEGEKFALVGESGSGKSITALSVLRLVDAAHTEGVIRFDGEDLMALPEARMRGLRGSRIGMIFQEPMTALNPLFTVGRQIGEVLALHEAMRPNAARARAIELLARTGIPEPERRVDAYPHQLSGGQRQRAMIAMALACRPRLLIADEPTTALDVTIQAQILELLLDLRRRTGMALVLITHDLGVVAETADRVVVQYAGRQVEAAPADTLFRAPHHPYTAALLDALPERARGRRLQDIPGLVPGQFDRPPGCLFAPRCAHVRPACAVAPAKAGERFSQALCHTPLVDGQPVALADGLEGRPA